MSKLKIIQVNKFLYPKGGADKYCLNLINDLNDSGNTVIPFGMSDEKNIKSIWSKYFSEKIDYYQNKNIFQTAIRLIWNREAARKFAALLDDFKPDLIHAHNIYHQLSPSILKEAKKRKIPIIMTLHDYKLICPNYLMFTHGKTCEKCLSGNYLNCISNNCYYSYSKSLLAALESFLHNTIWHSYRNNIDLFISPSIYLKEEMIQAAWEEQKIEVLTNPAPEYSPQSDGTRLLYFGRLSIEKGLDVLIEALKLTNENLDIVGSGSYESVLRSKVNQLGLEKRVSFYGQLEGEALEKLKREAKAIILPSLWAENMPLALLESLAYGKLIIASASGGSPELIEDNITGYLFPPGDYQMLANKINNLNNLKEGEREFIQKNIELKIRTLSLQHHLERLNNLYKQVLSKKIAN